MKIEIENHEETGNKIPGQTSFKEVRYGWEFANQNARKRPRPTRKCSDCIVSSEVSPKGDIPVRFMGATEQMSFFRFDVFFGPDFRLEFRCCRRRNPPPDVLRENEFEEPGSMELDSWTWTPNEKHDC